MVFEPRIAAFPVLETLERCAIIWQSFLFGCRSEIGSRTESLFVSLIGSAPSGLGNLAQAVTCAWNIISLLFTWLTPTLPLGISTDAALAGGPS